MEILGEIQNVRKDSKGIQINNDWYMFFKPNKEIKKGDYVSLEYKENKGFKNIKNIAIVEEVKEIKEVPNKPKLELTTLNTIIMCAKDIKIAFMDKNKNIKFKEITKEILEGLKEMRLSATSKITYL